MFEEDVDEDYYEDKYPRWHEEGIKPPVHLWAQHFLLPEPKRNPLFTNIFRVQLAVVKVHFPFLDKTQQLGKTYQKLGIPNICGELSKKFLQEYGKKYKFKNIKRLKETARAKSSKIRCSSSNNNNSNVRNYSKQMNVKIKRNVFNSVKHDLKSEQLYDELSEQSDLLFKAYTSKQRKTHPTENVLSIEKKCNKKNSINKKLLDQFKIFEDVLDKNNASVISYDKNQSNNFINIDKENSLPCENIAECGGKKLQDNIKKYSNKDVKKSSFRLKNNTLKKKVQFSDVNMFHYPPAYDDKFFSSCSEDDDTFSEKTEDKNETTNENPVSVENYDISDSLIEETSLKARNTFTVVAEVHNSDLNNSVKCGIDCNNIMNIHKNILPKHSNSNKFIDFDSIQVHEKGYHSDFENESTISILSDSDDIENNDLGCAVDSVNKDIVKNKNNYDENIVIRDDSKNGSDVSEFIDSFDDELNSVNNSINSHSQDFLEKFDKNEMYNSNYTENVAFSHITDSLSKKISDTSLQQDSFENIDLLRGLRDNNDCILDINISHINKKINDKLYCTGVPELVGNETTDFNQKYKMKNYNEQNVLVKNIDFNDGESSSDEVISQPFSAINNTVKGTILVPKLTDLKEVAKKAFHKTFPSSSSSVVGKLDSNNNENIHENSKNKKTDLNRFNNFVNTSIAECNDENDGLDNTFDLSYSSAISQSRMFKCHNSESDYSEIQFTNDNEIHDLNKQQKIEPDKMFFDKETESPEQTDINNKSYKDVQEPNTSLLLLEESLHENELLNDKFENSCQFSFENDISLPTQLKNQEHNEFKESDILCREKEFLSFETGSTEEVENISEQNSSNGVKKSIESIISISSVDKNHDITLNKESENCTELSCDEFTDSKFLNKAIIPDKNSDMETSQISYDSLITNLPAQYELNKNSNNLPYFDKTKFSDDSMDSFNTKSDNSEDLLPSSQLSSKNLSLQLSRNITSQSSAYKQLKNIPPLLDNVVNDSCNKTTANSIDVENAEDIDFQRIFPLYRRTPFDSPTAYFVSIDDLRKEYFENYLTAYEKKSSQNKSNTKFLDSCAMEQYRTADLTSPTQKMYRSSESSMSNKTQSVNMVGVSEISDSKDSTINSDEILTSQVIYSKQLSQNSKINDDENHKINVDSENCSSTIVTSKKISVTSKLFITKGDYEYKKEKFVEKDDEKVSDKENIRKSNKENKIKDIKISLSQCSKKSLHQNKKRKSSQKLEKYCSRLSVNENNTGKLSQHNKIFEVHSRKRKENTLLTENKNEDKLSQHKVIPIVHVEQEQLSQTKKYDTRLAQNLKKDEESLKHSDIIDVQIKEQIFSQKKVKEVVELSTSKNKKSSQSPPIFNENSSESILDDNRSDKFINNDSSNSRMTSVDMFAESGGNENVKTINEGEIELNQEEPVVNRTALSIENNFLEDSTNITKVLDLCLEENNFDNHSISRSPNLGNESMIIDENNALLDIHYDNNNNDVGNYEWSKSSSFNDNRIKEKNYVWINEAEIDPSDKKKSVVCKKSTSVKESTFSLLDIVTDNCHVNNQSVVEKITIGVNDCDKTSNDELDNIIWMNEAIIDQTTKNRVKDILSARLAHKRTIINENDINIGNDTIWMDEAIIDPEDSAGIYVDHNNFNVLSPISGEILEKCSSSLTLEDHNEISYLNQNKDSFTLHEEKIDTSKMSLGQRKRKISVTDHLLLGHLSPSKKHRLNIYQSKNDSKIKINNDKEIVKSTKTKSKLEKIDTCSQSIHLQKKEYDKQKIRDDTLISEDSDDDVMEETTSKYFKKTVFMSPHETNSIKVQSKMNSSIKSSTSTIMKINQDRLIESSRKSPNIMENARPLKDVTHSLLSQDNISKIKNDDKLSSISSDNIFDSPTRTATEGFEHYLKSDNINSKKASLMSDISDFNYSDLDKQLSDENLSKYLLSDEDNYELNIVDKNLNQVTDPVEKYNNNNANILDTHLTFELISSDDKSDGEESVTSSALSNEKRIEELKKMSSRHKNNVSGKHIVDKSLNNSLESSSKITDSYNSTDSLIKLKKDDKCLKWLNESHFTKYNLISRSLDEGSGNVSNNNDNYKNEKKYKHLFFNKSQPKSSTKEVSPSFNSYLNMLDDKNPRKIFSNKSMNLSINEIIKKYKLEDAKADDLLKYSDVDLSTSGSSNPNSIVKDEVSTSASNSLHGNSDLNMSPVSQGLTVLSSQSHQSSNKYSYTTGSENVSSSPINRWKINNIYYSPPDLKSDDSSD